MSENNESSRPFLLTVRVSKTDECQTWAFELKGEMEKALKAVRAFPDRFDVLYWTQNGNDGDFLCDSSEFIAWMVGQGGTHKVGPVEIGCRHCGSTNIVGADSVQVSQRIEGWNMGADGKLEPQWGSNDTHYDTQEPVDPKHPYYCRDCGEDLAVSDLKSLEPIDDDE